MCFSDNPVAFAKTGLDKYDIGTVPQAFKKAVVHPLAKSDPFKIIIDPDGGDHGCINPKVFI